MVRRAPDEPGVTAGPFLQRAAPLDQLFVRARRLPRPVRPPATTAGNFERQTLDRTRCRLRVIQRGGGGHGAAETPGRS